MYQQGYGTVLDSGTTFTYLPSPAFAAFLNAVRDHALAQGLQMTEGPDSNVRRPCDVVVVTVCTVACVNLSSTPASMLLHLCTTSDTRSSASIVSADL